jgi:hypothetical protein
MNIQEVKTAFKVADAVQDAEHKVRKMKFVFLDQIRDEKGNLLDKKILTDPAGRVYLLVSNGIIKKIGGSESKGGIRNTLSSYQSGLQGGPSIRTYGIHRLIAEELEQGNEIEVYMITSQKARMKVKGLFGEEEIDVGAFRDMEERCKKDYRVRMGENPPWNFKERNEDWRPDLLRDLNEHDRTRKALRRKLRPAEANK